MRQIVRILFGSHLYGTATPASDFDFKSVFVPDGRSILLQRARATLTDKRPKAAFEKNVAGEVEEERFSLQRFLGLAAEGQTVALDMLFAPASAWTDPPAVEWSEIIANRQRLLTRKSAAFIGYARRQANRFGIKGSRVAAARAALAILEAGLARHGTTAKLGVMEAEILASLGQHSAIVSVIQPGDVEVPMWEVVDRKMPLTASIKSAQAIMARVVAEYGHRALQAERQQGIDWKALSHAVRVGTQAVELLSSGHVTFPRPDAAHLLEIKLGRVRYQEVAAEIEGLLDRVEAAAEVSALPAEPDHSWIDGFVAEVHRREVLNVAA